MVTCVEAKLVWTLGKVERMRFFPEKPDVSCNYVNFPRFVSFVVLAMACLFALAIIAGCAPQSSTQAESAASGESSEQAADQSSSSSKRPSEKDIARYNEWADDVVCDALNNLADDGVIAEPAGDATYLQEAFEYYHNDIAFLDKEAGNELSGNYRLPEGKVIMGWFDSITSDAAHSTEVFYANGNWGPADHNEPTLFYPQSMFGVFDQYIMQDALRDVPTDAFANSIDECDYLIVFDAVDSSIKEKYYAGGYDRISVTTLALVIDVNRGKVVHIENVGTDTPGDYQVTNNSGSMLKQKLAEYLDGLLLNRV